jgi:lysophospholipase L1-like esterase
MTRTTKLFAAAALGIVLGASACQNDELFRPANFTPIDPLFERYVSMGNSITAGFQSAGINDSTQSQAYPVLLANAMRSPFFPPLLNRPGCPPPFTNVFTQARVSGGTPTTCALRKPSVVPPPYVSNTAVPGAEVLDIYNNLDTASNSNTLTTFILGGLTQAQMMARAQPTFVSIWIGNNDVLGAATSATNGGDTTKITSVANFQTRSTAAFDAVAAAGPRGAIVIGVANVTLIPFFSRGATYWAIKNGLVPGAAFPATMAVDNNCAPIVTGIPGARGDSTLVPFPYGALLLGTAQAGFPATLSCSDTIPRVVVPAELRKLLATVAAYNAFDSTQAVTRGWAWVNPNPLLAALAADTAQVRAFPYFPQGNAGDTVALRRPFGRGFSLDAVHPSASTHKTIANALRTAINAKYGTSIPAIP